MLGVCDLYFSYGEINVLSNVNLEIKDGEYVALFGPNGHGKSTLLKVVCGLLIPTSGAVKYNGTNITKFPVQIKVDMGLVYIAEDRHLFPDMTVIDNLRTGAYARNARMKEDESLEYVFQLFPKLKTLRYRYAKTLSGGESRMVAIGRGLMSNPNFLAIDEPSFGLAPNLQVEVFKAIDQIRKMGCTVFLVEQSTAIAVEYADRVLAIEDGKLVFQGTKEQILKNDSFREIHLGL
jgi:branched-chain amino acid transport system ATP-binding protein